MPERGYVAGGDIAVLEGSTFMLSDALGDLNAGSIQGLFHDDTRFLSRYELTVDGNRPLLLTSRQVDYYSAAFFLTNPEGQALHERAISIQRHRFVGMGLHDDLVVMNHLNRPVRFTIRLSFGVDFADLFEVKDERAEKDGEIRRDHDPDEGWLLRFSYENGPFRVATVVSFSQRPRIEGDDVFFDLELDAHQEWETCIEVSMHHGDVDLEPVHGHGAFGESEREADQVLQKWRDEVPTLEANWDPLRHVYRRSIVDLAALRLNTEVGGMDYSLPAAGLPWFMTIFGRDTLIVSYQSLPVGPELAAGALRALAAHQATETDDFRDAEPGKILHEIRHGELTALGRKPHSPYYGTADATPLFLVVLSEYWRFTGDDALVRELEPNARAALRWLEDFGDADGDGFIEYRTRSDQGLRNQGWKDSWNAVLFADGEVAQPPIALCEVQGYAYDARVRAAELAERVWGDAQLAANLREAAAKLRDRFDEEFWLEDRGHYAMALDAEKRAVDACTSNIGHLLWSGIVPEERAPRLAEALFSPEMWSGWGIRTMSSADGGYSPIAYHNGTVWPHDNAILAAGLARYGFRAEAARIAVALLEAATFTDHRLPEVFAGYERERSRFPVRYPTASSPQAWATGAPFLLLRTLLGMDPRDGELALDPHLPKALGHVRWSGVQAFGRRFEIEAEGDAGEARG